MIRFIINISFLLYSSIINHFKLILIINHFKLIMIISLIIILLNFIINKFTQSVINYYKCFCLFIQFIKINYKIIY